MKVYKLLERVENIVAKGEINCSSKVVCYRGVIKRIYVGKGLINPFPSYDNSAADDFEHILSKNRKSL